MYNHLNKISCYFLLTAEKSVAIVIGVNRNYFVLIKVNRNGCKKLSERLENRKDLKHEEIGNWFSCLLYTSPIPRD